MENQPIEQKKEENALESFKSHNPEKSPWLLKVVGILMAVSGAVNAISALFILVFFPAFGLVMAVYAGLAIKYGIDIYKTKKKGYTGGLAVAALNILISLVINLVPNINIHIIGRDTILAHAPTIFTMAALYYYREKFVN